MTDIKDIAVGFVSGLARRMGGVNKALLEIGGQTVLERQLAAANVRLINANGDARLFSLLVCLLWQIILLIIQPSCRSSGVP